MLSSCGIKAGGGADKYYAGLAKEDYYNDGGEPPGRWVGKQAEELGLSGNVAKGELTAIMNGFHPQTGEALTKRLGPDHKPGEDLTFSAPKSVSLAWANADPATQKAIAEAMHESVAKTIEKMERDGSFRTQHGHNGTEKQAYTGGLVVATYEHSTSREGDPQLHVHALVQNVSPDARNIDFDKSLMKANGAYFRADLADRLAQMGFTIERDKTSFRIAQIPKQLEKDFSTRRQQIEAALKERGLSGGKASAAATMSTRQDKGEVNRAELFANARAASAEFGVTAASIEAMRQGGEKPAIEPMPELPELANLVIGQQSTVTPQQLEAAIYQESQGKLSADQAEQLFENLKNSPDLIELRDHNGNTRYTSREMYEIERRIADRAAAMSKELTHSVSAQSLTAAMAEKKTLSDEQKAALIHITGPERIALVEGYAGAGKSFMIDAARDAWERDGYTVRGFARDGKAAEGLEKSSGIEASTIASALLKIENGKLTLDAKTIVVVDEAGMCDSRLMSRLQDHVDQAGGKLVLIGDTSQLQPIDAGGAMRAQREAIGKFAVMNDIRRQHNDADKAMVHDAKAGRSEKVIAYLEANDRLHQHADREAVTNAMAAGTVADLAARKTSLALAESRAEVHAINQCARDHAKAAGLVQGEDSKFSADRGERQFAPGDRVIFLENSKDLGVKNGTTGTVEKASDGMLTVRLDDTAKKSKDGKEDLATATRVTVHQDIYNKLDHGYAMTVHKSQGVTVDRAHYAPGAMAHRELAYVALSRQRETVQMHITRDQRDGLAKQLANSQAKGSSSDFAKVEKYQNAIDQAEARVRSADAAIKTLEAKIEAERGRLSEAQEKQLAAEINHAKEQQNAKPEPDRYGRIDPEQRRAVATLRERDVAADRLAGFGQAESIERMRDVSGIHLVHERGSEKNKERGNAEVLLQNNERYDMANRDTDGNHELRRQGTGVHADRGSETQSGGKGRAEDEHASGVVRAAQREGGSHQTTRSGARSQGGSESRSEGGRTRSQGSRESSGARSESERAVTKSAERLDKLEKQLVEAKAEFTKAAKAEDSARLKQANAWDKEKAAKAQPAKEQPKFAATMNRDPAETVKRDGELARKALESHKAGERLPEGKKLDKAIKTGELKITKDSEGRTYFQNTKNGATLAKSLNPAAQRSTTSRNLNHLGATSTKYTIVDKKVLGVKIGTSVLKSGGSLKAEAAGRMRDALRETTKGNALAKAIAKPLDHALKKGEHWQKAGMLESVAARIQIKAEQAKAIREAKRELEAKVKAADATAKRERDPLLAATKEGAKETRQELRKDADRGVELPPSKAAEAAKELAGRELPEPKAPTKEIEAPKKDAGRDFGR